VSALVKDVLIGSAGHPPMPAIREAVSPIVEGLGYTLLGVELALEGRRRALWVYIDRDGGVGIEDCARVSPEVSAALDVADPVEEAYDLRISSPGLDRPLFSAVQFRAAAGEQVVVQLDLPLDGRRKLTGEILGVEDAEVELRWHGGGTPQVVQIPIDAIRRARVKYTR